MRRRHSNYPREIPLRLSWIWTSTETFVSEPNSCEKTRTTQNPAWTSFPRSVWARTCSDNAASCREAAGSHLQPDETSAVTRERSLEHIPSFFMMKCTICPTVSLFSLLVSFSSGNTNQQKPVSSCSSGEAVKIHHQESLLFVYVVSYSQCGRVALTRKQKSESALKKKKEEKSYNQIISKLLIIFPLLKEELLKWTEAIISFSSFPYKSWYLNYG